MNDYYESTEYELLTQAVYREILQLDSVNTVNVQHNVQLRGQSGVEHQVDVFWEFRQGDVRHAVLIECKRYSKAICLEKVRNFFAVLHDVGNCVGIMVTTVGYQSGVQQFAAHYGIQLKLLRRPREEDWDGRLRDIQMRLDFRAPVSPPGTNINVNVHLALATDEERVRLRTLNNAGRLILPAGPDIRLCDRHGIPVTAELRWWIPRQLPLSERAVGEPYTDEISANGLYIVANSGTPDEEIVPLRALEVTYHVAIVESRRLLLLGDQIVQVALRDVATGQVEHMRHHSHPRTGSPDNPSTANGDDDPNLSLC